MASIDDVAKRAEVSKTTVSHALSGKRPVAEATREKIFKAIAELNYVPNYMARGLTSRRSNIIGLAYPVGVDDKWILSDVAVEFIIASAYNVNQYGYDFSLSTKPGVDEIARLVRGGHIDGIILMEICMQDERVEFLREEDYPFVLVGRCENNDGIDYVDIDAEYGAYEACRHLVNLGHRDIGLMIVKPKDFGYSVRALQGYERALREYGIKVEQDLIIESSVHEEAGFASMKALTEARADCSACIVISDRVLLGALRYCQESGRSVPQDISFVGMGSSHYQGLMHPPITSVEMPALEMSRRAVDLLTARLRGEPVDRNQIVLRPQVIHRDSTAPPAQSLGRL